LAATTEEVCVGTRFLVEFVGHSSNDLDTSRAIFGADEILARDRVFFLSESSIVCRPPLNIASC
ncbi:MAG: hypothetical protein ABSB82_16330, partial [Terriglobia bacterium]|jgi:hypothetical protein